MKVYCVEICDYDLSGDYGYYQKLEDAQTKFKELMNDPNFFWKKYLRITTINVKA